MKIAVQFRGEHFNVVTFILFVDTSLLHKFERRENKLLVLYTVLIKSEVCAVVALPTIAIEL